MKKTIPTRLKPLTRAFRIDTTQAETSVVDIAARTMRLSFSSEEPVDMGWCTEILSHAKGAVKVAGRQQTMPLLFNHNMNDLLGIVEAIEVGPDKRGYAVIRFGKDERGEWAMQQAADGILINASFMYRVYKYEEDTQSETITATLWEPFEISLVTVPADASVGVGRAAGDNENDVEISQRQPPTETLEKPESAQAGFILPDESRNNTAAAETLEGTTMNKRHILQDKANDGTGGSAGATLSAEEITRIQNEIRAQAIGDERARATEVEAMCRTHKLDENFRNTLINGNFDIAECRGRVLVELGNRGKQAPLGSLSADMGLTDKEQRNYSLMRAVNAIVSGSWKEAGFEKEVSEEIAKRNQRDNSGTSFFMPNDLPYAPTREHLRALNAVNGRNRNSQRAIYQVGTAGQGGNLVETDLLAESFIEVLRNMTVTSALGATYLPGLVGNVDIPRQISATGTYWVGESTALTEAEATFDKVSLRPKTIGALSKISRLMLLQATPAIEMLARRDLMSVGALAIDLAALSGAGTGGSPTGIVNQAGVGSVVGGAAGANLSFDHIIQLQYATKFANAPQSSAGFALNSKSIGYLATLKATTGQYLWDPQGGLTNESPDRLKGRPYAESQQLRSNLSKSTSNGICSELIYGNWQELLIGEWGVTEIALNPYDSTGFANGDVILRMFQTIDIAVRHGASFAVMSDALTPGF